MMTLSAPKCARTPSESFDVQFYGKKKKKSEEQSLALRNDNYHEALSETQTHQQSSVKLTY